MQLKAIILRGGDKAHIAHGVVYAYLADVHGGITVLLASSRGSYRRSLAST